MKLSTVPNGTPDGELFIVARDNATMVSATGIAPTLQSALDRWNDVAPALAQRAAQLNEGSAKGALAFPPPALSAPLPRAWQWLDGSAFHSHGELASRVYGINPPSRVRPLMYQGLSNPFLGPNDDVEFTTEDDGIDFEGEFGVIVDEVPMGISAADAAQHIRLVVQINDWSLRFIGPEEMKTGFGFVQTKPACSMAPIAVTPDELGTAWENCRIGLDLHVVWNGALFGKPNGREMGFGFHELVAHAARTRRLCAGTIIGSGTVANATFREVGSACIAERRGMEKGDHGNERTPYMKFGDTIRMEARTAEGRALLGAIDQKVVRVRTARAPFV